MFKQLKAFVILVALLLGGFSSSLRAGNYYASNAGGGNGSSTSSPFRVSDFLVIAKPGDTLFLLDGVYTGGSSMIVPPSGISGTSSALITIKALNDGKVLIDGQGTGYPVLIKGGAYYRIEGINAANAAESVVSITAGAHDNLITRVCAWNAKDGNNSVFAASGSTYNTFEDCAGWGIARKVFTSSQDGNSTTFRRCYGRFMKSNYIGPKQTFAPFYNNYNLLMDRCIGAWDSQVTTLDQPYGPLAADNVTGGHSDVMNSSILNSLFYILSSASTGGLSQLALIDTMQAIKIDGCVFYSGKTSVKTGVFGGLSSGSASGLSLSNNYFIGPAPQITSDWKQSGNAYWSSVQSTPVLISSLIPWPMNARIRESSVSSGYGLIDVEAEVSSIFGTLPPPSSTPPTNLRIVQ